MAVKIAVIGKGGSGKSAIAGTLCRALAGRGRDVVALDADHVPGLAMSIGLDAGERWLLSEAAVFEENKGWDLVVTPQEAVERYSLEGPGGIRFLQYGKMSGQMTREQRASSAALIRIAKNLEADSADVVIDLAAGPRQSYTGWMSEGVTVLVVVEPSFKSLMTARRMLRLGEKDGTRLLGIANKFSSERERRWLQDQMRGIKLAPWAEVPADATFARAEREGRAPIDLDPSSPAVAAVEHMAGRLIDMPAVVLG